MAMRVKPDTGEVGLKQRYRVTNWVGVRPGLGQPGQSDDWVRRSEYSGPVDTPTTGWPWQARAVLGNRHSDVPDDQGLVPVALPRHGRADQVADAPLSPGPAGAGPHPHVATGR
jgi:hypothetical protein